MMSFYSHWYSPRRAGAEPSWYCACLVHRALSLILSLSWALRMQRQEDREFKVTLWLYSEFGCIVSLRLAIREGWL